LFDNAPPQDTQVLNQSLDSQAPTTTLTATRLANGSDFEGRWSAQDDPGGSGVKHVSVYVAEDGGDFKLLLGQTTDTGTIFQCGAGHSYEFLALATDNAGNREQPPLGILTPDDGSSANLGTLPTEATTREELGPPPAPTAGTASPLFVEAEQGIPAGAPAN